MPSWTLSGFADEIDDEPAVQMAVLQALGARHVEVRSAWGQNALDWDDARLAAFARITADAGMQVSAVASPIGKSPARSDPEFELARLHRAITVAGALGTRYIRIFSFYPGEATDATEVRDIVLTRLSDLAARAAEAQVTLLHENEKGIYGDIPERVLDIVESVGSDALRLAWDSANFVQVGVRPFTDAYPLLHPYIEYLQVKDADSRTNVAVPAGEGDGEMWETLTALKDAGYVGFASLEPHLPAAEGAAGFPGAAEFGRAARAFRGLTDSIGVELR